MPPPRSWVHDFRTQGAPDDQGGNPFFMPDGEKTPMFAEKTLIVPIVSAANVPQLAIDVLIATLSFSRVGCFSPSDLVPVVGGREGGEHGVTTPLELYGKDGVSFVLIQQRSPVLKSRKEQFISSLLTFVRDSGFKTLLFLASVNLTNRTDSQMFTSIYHLLPPASPSLADSPLASLSSFPRYTAPSNPQHKAPSMPGGGLTQRIFSTIPDDWTTRTGFLISFALEGDNTADAIFMAGAVTKLLLADERIQEWKQPESWKQGLFGTGHDQTLFG